MWNSSNRPAVMDISDLDDSNFSFWNIGGALEFSDNDFEDNSNFSDNDLYSDWCDPDEHKFTIKTFQACVFSVIFTLGVVGNGLVITTFVAYRCVRLRSMTDVFLLHLALADLLSLLMLPLQAIDTHRTLPVYLCKVMRAGYAVNQYSGLLLLACISVDRYLVVVHAQVMHHLRKWIFRVGMLTALGVWAVAVILSLPEILFSGVSGSGVDAYCGVLGQAAKMAARAAIIGVFCLSFLVMVTCYTLIAKVLWEGQAQRRGKQWQRQRTLKLMLALVLLFLAFQLPYTVVLLQRLAGEFRGLLLEYVTCTLAYARCCLNPILYALVGVRFRNDVLRLMHSAGRSCGCKPVPHITSSISPSSPALTMLSVGPSAYSERVFFSSDAVASNK
ncbi:C-C chemokine receptor type 10 isoform X1 [Takifugu rubripes]|uniref:C-C chemokine receptor type 10 isoform X1 n=2 Tax=Takifugu rubripes TaxID=31033 RepID=UPI00114577C6|nr:CCR10 protein isoform X1 [Takifugu rubripes]